VRPSFAVSGGLLAALALVVGCQSGGQQDLVAREMRMQEDQIYAMQNYLEDYQKLLCKYRAENAALKRQVAEGRSPEPKPKDADSSPEEKPRQQPTPPKDVNQDQDTESKPEGGPDIQLPPAPEIEDPDVPPLDATKSTQADLSWDQEDELQGGRRDSQVATAAAIEPITASEEAAPPEVTTETEPLVERVALIETTKARGLQSGPHAAHSSNPIWVHGEVVMNDAGGGPRMLVEVEPLENAVGPGPFVGRAEVMVLNPTNGGTPEPVARWNFSADAVQAATSDSDDGRTMQFRLELPAETPNTKPVELWVRLLPAEGGKLLAYVPLDLQQAGQFSSIDSNAMPRHGGERLESPGHSLTPLASHEPMSRHPRVAKSVDGDGWTTALPGEPSDAQCVTESQWRASSEPIPAIVQAFVPASQVLAPAPAVVQAAALEVPIIASKSDANRTESAGETVEAASTAPTSDGSPAKPQVASKPRPVWSPTR
jgi:hypothetical protein